MIIVFIRMPGTMKAVPVKRGFIKGIFFFIGMLQLPEYRKSDGDCEKNQQDIKGYQPKCSPKN